MIHHVKEAIPRIVNDLPTIKRIKLFIACGAGVLFFILSPLSWAVVPPGAKLESLSSSGKTALLNRGTHDDIQEGDYAVLLKQTKDLKAKDLKLVPVAKLRNIKVSTMESVWIVFHRYDDELLTVGESYLLFSESQLLQGRRELEIGKIKVVAAKDELVKKVHQTLRDDKDMASHFESLYPEAKSLHPRERRSDFDAEVLDIEQWNKTQDGYYASAIYKSSHQRDFARRLRVSTFEKLVTAYLKKVNQPNFSYEAFYADFWNKDLLGNYSPKSSFQTEWTKFLEQEKKSKNQESKLLKEILNKGETWSEDYSDEELALFLRQTSSLHEKERRQFFAEEPKRWSWFVSYGQLLKNNQDRSDTEIGKTPYFVETELEYIPFIHSRKGQRLTIQAFISKLQTVTPLSGFNTELDILSLGLGLNWYFLFSPTATYAPAFFVGTFFRSGLATAESIGLDESARFTTASYFGGKLGMKLKFTSNIGLRIALSMEKLNLDRFEQSKLNSGFPDESSFLSWGSSFSLFYSF